MSRIQNIKKPFYYLVSIPPLLPGGREGLGGRAWINMGDCKAWSGGCWQLAGKLVGARLRGMTGGVGGSSSTSKSSARPPPKNLASSNACLRGSTFVWDWLSILDGGEGGGAYIRTSAAAALGQKVGGIGLSGGYRRVRRKLQIYAGLPH